ncbi:hypothetical protein ACXYMU_09955 [Pontibacter sp. CAU 1760]
MHALFGAAAPLIGMLLGEPATGMFLTAASVVAVPEELPAVLPHTLTVGGQSVK